MDNFQFVDRYSFVFAAFFFIGGTILFYSQNGQLLGSLVAALIAGALAWVAYVLTRWLILALK